MRADQHSVDRLAGAASIDRCVRMPGLTWRETELPTDEQAAGLLDAGASPDVVLAHEALAVPGLIQRLGDSHGWRPDDLAYAREAQQVHTARVLSVLDPAKETLCVTGHYHFRHLEQAVLDGMPVRQDLRPGRLSRCAGRARPGQRRSALRGGSDGPSASAPAA
ncbi:hypothetical protein [Streptomyces sp. ALI-76-A]|uniref:hypothetical protein n=1 Tax=Streptomyces sp. ALI-76-A TaxID=3025736 RepID=UPI00256F31E6|nr:hypothetical protein [Streptomyces sp. ALI-76-A]MDL5199725.1 hypothetical protein [Streptomyces sp. ALI-76-A]